MRNNFFQTSLKNLKLLQYCLLVASHIHHFFNLQPNLAHGTENVAEWESETLQQSGPILLIDRDHDEKSREEPYGGDRNSTWTSIRQSRATGGRFDRQRSQYCCKEISNCAISCSVCICSIGDSFSLLHIELFWRLAFQIQAVRKYWKALHRCDTRAWWFH